MTHLITGADGVARCWWTGTDPLYLDYHDNEWGRAEADDHRLFEKVCLEGFHAGLSWPTILRKRENFRRAFRDFDYTVVARFNTASVARLLGDAGIVRHRGKIESTINNARRAIEMVEAEGSLARFFWSFEPEPAPPNVEASITPASTALSREMKRRGWTFVGPTTAYAFMQAMGLVNDHVDGCHARAAAAATRAAIILP